jgi:hypothetical protein
MSQGDRNTLLNEIEELRSSIDKLQPETYAPEIDGQDNSRKQLKALRKELACEMEQLHESPRYEE